MWLRELSLDHFRSYASLNMPWRGSGTEVLVGPNGSGKTNILEAVGVLATGESPLGIEPDNLPTFGSDHFRVRGTFTHDAGEECIVEVAWQRAPRRAKAMFINDVRVAPANFPGRIPIVPFLPSDLDLFTGSPARRRAFFDHILRQISPAFSVASHRYDACLKQRNALLRSIQDQTAKPQDLAIWDEQLADHGAVLRAERISLLSRLESMLPDIVTTLAEHPQSLQLLHLSKAEERSVPALRAELLTHLLRCRERDMIVGSTTVGPHRDDIDLIVDGHSVGVTASRGQQRAYLLGLLFAHVRILMDTRGEKPIILLDDVFSELDAKHGAALMESLGDCQVFLATTHIPHGGSAALYSVSGHKIQPMAQACAV